MVLLSAQTITGGAQPVEGENATDATLVNIRTIGIDSESRLLIATGDGRVRRVEQNGTMRTIAGSGRIGLPSAGPALETALTAPEYMVGLDDGSILFGWGRGGPIGVADRKGQRWEKEIPTPLSVWRLSNGRLERWLNSGLVDLVANKWCQAYDTLRDLRMCNLSGMTRDPEGNVYLSDDGIGQILKVAPNGTISRVYGTGHNPNGLNPVGPKDVAWANGSLWFRQDEPDKSYGITRPQSNLFRVDSPGSATAVPIVLEHLPLGDRWPTQELQWGITPSPMPAGKDLIVQNREVFFRIGPDLVSHRLVGFGNEDPELGGNAVEASLGPSWRNIAELRTATGLADGSVFVTNDSMVYRIANGKVQRVAGHPLPNVVPGNEFPLARLTYSIEALRIADDGTPLFLDQTGWSSLWRFELGAFRRITGTGNNPGGEPLADGMPALGRNSVIRGFSPGCGREIYVSTSEGGFRIDENGIAHRLPGYLWGGQCGAMYSTSAIWEFYGPDNKAVPVHGIWAGSGSSPPQFISTDHRGGIYAITPAGWGGWWVPHVSVNEEIGVRLERYWWPTSFAGLSPSEAFSTEDPRSLYGSSNLSYLRSGYDRATVAVGSPAGKLAPTDGPYTNEPLTIRTIATDNARGLWMVDDRWLRRFTVGFSPSSNPTTSVPTNTGSSSTTSSVSSSTSTTSPSPTSGPSTTNSSVSTTSAAPAGPAPTTEVLSLPVPPPPTWPSETMGTSQAPLVTVPTVTVTTDAATGRSVRSPNSGSATAATVSAETTLPIAKAPNQREGTGQQALGSIKIVAAKPGSIVSLSTVTGRQIQRMTVPRTGEVFLNRLANGAYTVQWTTKAGVRRQAQATICDARLLPNASYCPAI